MLNEAFGWFWISMGFATGAVLGLFFRRADFLGGYDALPRRLVRLGHIAFFGTGLLNVLFAFSMERVALPAPWPVAASWSFIAGAAAMPVCCFLVAWRERLHPLFVAPVLLLSFGGTVAWVGLFRGVVLSDGG